MPEKTRLHILPNKMHRDTYFACLCVSFCKKYCIEYHLHKKTNESLCKCTGMRKTMKKG